MKAKRSGGNGNVVAVTLLVIAASFSIPFVAHITKVRSELYPLCRILGLT